VDPPALNRDFAAALGVSFPLLSDVGGRVGTLYGVYNPKGRNHERANVVIDASGVIRHIERGAAAIDPTGALRACQVIPQGR
jgi:peroxiredoxin